MEYSLKTQAADGVYIGRGGRQHFCKIFLTSYHLLTIHVCKPAVGFYPHLHNMLNALNTVHIIDIVLE